MRRVTTQIMVLAIGVFVLIAVAAAADYESIEASNALRINFCPYDIGKDWESADTTFVECQLFTGAGRMRALWAWSSTASPVWPLEDMLGWLSMPSDLILLSSHGLPYHGLAMEAYDSPDNRDAVYEQYITSGSYSYDEIGKAASERSGYYFVTAKPALPEQNSPCNGRSIIMVAACYSDYWRFSWGSLSEIAHIGYDYSPQSDHVKEHISRVFCRLRGLGGRTMRSSGEAISGLPVTQRGRTDLVINPAVEEMYPPHHTELDGEFTGAYVQFGAALTTERRWSS